MNHAHVRVLSGPIFQACETYFAKVQAADEAVNAIAVEFGCPPGQRLSRGAWLEGLRYPKPGVPSKDWSPVGKKFPGFIKPNSRTLAGRAILARLEAIKLPVPEDFAFLLGFPPFFNELGGGGYCSAAGGFMRGGVYYLEFPLMLSHYLKDKPGVEFIKPWEYLKAEDEK